MEQEAELSTTDNQVLNERPFIGILTREDKFNLYGDEFVDASYVRFLQMAGAQVVPVRPKRERHYYEQLFKSINGLFLPGGASSVTQGTYRNSGEIMFQLAIEANKRGDFFPVFGICSGFELMVNLISNEFKLKATNTKNTLLPVKFHPGFEKSRLFKGLPQEMVRYLSEENSTHNNHQWSSILQDFQTSWPLTQFYQVLTTSQCGDDEFVSMFEAHSYPFYGIQWHPERSIFNWSKNLTINRSCHSVKVSQYLANFFVSEARKNLHHFDSIEEEARAVIENAKRIFVPDFNFAERFYFNYTDDAEF